MNEYTCFIAGFLAASVVFSVLIVTYYCRARRRVHSIKAAIERYHAASQEVNHALNRLDQQQSKT